MFTQFGPFHFCFSVTEVALQQPLQVPLLSAYAEVPGLKVPRISPLRQGEARRGKQATTEEETHHVIPNAQIFPHPYLSAVEHKKYNT